VTISYKIGTIESQQQWSSYSINNERSKAKIGTVASETIMELKDSMDETVTSSENVPIIIAHVVSLITCSQATRVKGFLDALILLRHSIHRNSVHSETYRAARAISEQSHQPSSSYSYQMFAIVREDDSGCMEHLPLLERLGYIPLVRPIPINVSAITTNDWYRNHVQYENCCGPAEFVKLYAYQLIEYPIVVHWDLDVAILSPMDDLFDAMLYDKDSVRGRHARHQLQIQKGVGQHQLPDRIDAYFTRDVTSSNPWEPIRAVQGGFVVVRPSLDHFRRYIDFIMQANYTPGRGPNSGWGGLGYGGFQGAMAYQGVLAYFYDHIYPGHAVELDVCRWNQVVADVIYRGPDRMELNGTCRQYPHESNGDFVTNTPENGRCYDCRVLPISETRTVHYTACKKPWECRLPFPRIPKERNKAQTYRLRELTNITTCRGLFRKYFEMRHEVEALIAASRGATIPMQLPSGGYEPETFLGYCTKQGSYLPMEETLPPNFNMWEVYGF
jgi:hypothetical protein